MTQMSSVDPSQDLEIRLNAGLDVCSSYMQTDRVSMGGVACAGPSWPPGPCSRALMILLKAPANLPAVGWPFPIWSDCLA